MAPGEQLGVHAPPDGGPVHTNAGLSSSGRYVSALRTYVPIALDARSRAVTRTQYAWSATSEGKSVDTNGCSVSLPKGLRPFQPEPSGVHAVVAVFVFQCSSVAVH